MPPRESSKHGPQLDDQMAHETEGLVRGGRTTHAEEWKDTEPTDPARLRRPEPPGSQTKISGDDLERRSALARALKRSVFPADRDGLLSYLAQSGAPAELTEAAAALPAGVPFRSVGEVARALGLDLEPERF